MFSSKTLSLSMLAGLLVMSASAFGLQYDQNVTNNVIFGDGNANGGFTTDRAGGVEIGLRAHLRFDANGHPQNIFNSDGAGTYTFNAGIAPTRSLPDSEWTIDFSVNTNYDGSSSYKLNSLTYTLSMSGPSGTPASFDPINVTYVDHSIGDNDTTASTDHVASKNDTLTYASLISTYSLAQNSWRPQWIISGFDPRVPGIYTVSLTAFDGAATQIASSTINIQAVPEPASLGLLALGGLALLRRRRHA